VHERGRLQYVATTLPPQMRARHAAEIIVYKWDEAGETVGIVVIPLSE
jgi:hypothetical protein